ncbi:MFS transporter [Dongia sp. agr-C8]
MKWHYGWVIVLAGAVMTCIGAGALFSLPVFLRPIETDTGWSMTALGGSMSIAFLVMGAAGFGWGALSDRIGARPVLVVGNLLAGLGLIMASRSATLLEFQIWYGVVIGIAGGSYFPPLIATTVGWFEKHRSLAVSLVSVGIGVAPMTVSPFAEWLIATYQWREAQFIIGVAVLVLLVPMAFLIRRPPDVPVDVAETPQPMAPQPMAAQPEQSSLTVGQALRTPQFIVLALVFFACCACHSGPIIHTVSFAQLCGIAPAYAVTIYSVEGVGGLFGRFVLGLAGDRFGVKPTLIVGLLIQAVGAGAYLYAGNLEVFYIVAFIFGFAYGGVMPLYAVLARDYFGPKIMGAIMGAAAMISSLGMALGPAIGGWVYDTWNAYTGLYVASAVVGLGAVAIALAFPPQRRAVMRPA